jgi:hypothetical protein
MDRDEILLRDKIKNLLEVYSFEEILEHNDMTIEDCIVFMIANYGLLLPDYGPLE